MKLLSCNRTAKRTLLTAVALFTVCTVCLTAVLLYVPPLAAVPTAANERLLPVYCTDRDDNVVSLTFDAAWGDEDTPTLIDILARYNVKATFFVVGEWVDRCGDSVKALADAGHEIMNHSDDHPYFTKLSADQ
ncbi:MAG: polysaccharide deacetylase family protein, partial [Clostridia bacterium]|nr:polysaccharide deacetylase family protein [Clostridia bacterium]